MEQPVKNRVSQRGIPQRLMPVVHRELTRDQGRASPVPVFQEFEYVTSVLIIESGQPPVIENGDFCTTPRIGALAGSSEVKRHWDLV
jgi:hypothetical protein